MATLSGKTFEVQVLDGGRWTTMDVHLGRTPAITQAEQLSETGKYRAVQVLSDSDRAGTEVVFEKTLDSDDEKPITINAIQDSPVCDDIIDYYRPPARRTLAKVLRNYLDEKCISALELMFDRTEIILLERNDSLFPQLIQQIASAQARVLSVKPTERADVLYAMATRLNENALEFVNEEDGVAVLKKDGVDGLLKWANKKADTPRSYLFICHAFAASLADGGDWNGKIKGLVELADGELSAPAIDYIDEVLAEILEGGAAVGELLGGQPDAFSANRAMLQLCEGRYEPRGTPVSCIVQFNDLMGRHVLPQTRTVMYERVASYLSGTRNLTREGPTADREAFVRLLRNLVEIAGLKGGSLMCESLTMRARLALSDGDDLSFEEAMLKIVDILPNRASRIGYLLDLFQSDLGKRNGSRVLAALGRTIEQMKSLASLVPAGASEQTVAGAIEGLREKMMSEGLPAEWRKTLSDTFDKLMAKPKVDSRARRALTISDEEFREMIAKAPERKDISEGEILFQEGDSGSEAYLVMSGHLEIYRKIGNREEVIAKVGRGDIIGEMSLIDNQPRMASARVLEGGQVTVIDQGSFDARLDNLGSSDRVLRRLIDVLVNRIRGEGSTFT